MDTAVSEEDVKAKLEKRFNLPAEKTVIPRKRRMFVEIPRENLAEAAAFARNDLGFTHLSVITGLDSGENLEFLYHLFGNGIVLTLRTKAPVSDPKVPTVIGVFPGAESYERELEDLLGAKVEGLPPGRRYPLPEGWPQGQHPLRKNWKKTDVFPEEKKG